MKQIQFCSSTGKVLIEWDFDGDYVVRIAAKMLGFRGHADGHVLEGEFIEFARDAIDLNNIRNGEAKLKSANPGEFELSIRSIDDIGHMGVFGLLTYGSLQNRTEVQRLEFSLEFPPEQLDTAAKALSEVAT